MIVASRVEHALSKAEILELYLNSVYLGRGSWGIELAARSYFGKPAKDLTLEEGALLAGLTKGPNYFNPDRHPGRAQERLAYVLSRLREDGAIPADERRAADCPRCRRWWPTSGRAATSASISSIRSRARPSRSPASRRSRPIPTRCARPSTRNCSGRWRRRCRKGLSRYERNAGRVQFRGAEASLAKAVQRIEADKKAGDKQPAWQQALANARLPLYDVHWTPAWWWRSRRARRAKRGGSAWRRAHPAALGRQRGRAAQAHALRRGPRARGRGQGQDRGAGRAARAPGGAGNGGRAGEQDRPHPGHDRRLFVSAEPAQPGDAGRAPARLRDQAAELSRGPAPGACSPTRWSATIRSRCRRSAAVARASRTTGRRRTTTAAAAAFSPCGGRSRTRAISPPSICSTAASRTLRKRASIVFAGSRWRRRSIANACATIRSCSARSRCGRSISQLSMRRSRMKACGRSPYRDRIRSSAMARPSIAMIRNRRSRSPRSTAPRSISSRP